MAIEIATDDDRLKRLRAPKITPMGTPAAPRVPPPEKTGGQMIGNYVAEKAAEKYGGPLVNKGLEKVAGMFTPAAAAPTQAAIASQAASSSTALPLMQSVMGGAGTGAAASPMLAALGPVGMAIGAGLLLKQFGLFSKGGHVGPLYVAHNK